MESVTVCHEDVARPSRETPSLFGSDPSESYAFVHGLIDGMRCGILAVDTDARLLMLNGQARQILGVDSLQPGLPIAQALADFPRLVQLLTESFHMKSLPNRAELQLSAEGTGKRIGFTLSMIPGSDRPLGAAIFFKDLTRIEHVEEQERLKDRLAAVGQTAASLAHEIRNPLASIEISCGLLRRRLGDAHEAVELLDKVTAEVRRLNRTVTASLDYVRPVASNLQHAALTSVLEEARQVALGRRGGAGVEVGIELPTELPDFLMDRQQLRQVFENLVLNALEAAGAEARVRISVEIVPAPSTTTIPYEPAGPPLDDPWSRFEQVAVIRVADNGPGVSEQERDRIFHPFYTTKKQGAGVGLSMVNKIVDSHRGSIDVDDAPEGGAVFTVRLPMVMRQAEE